MTSYPFVPFGRSATALPPPPATGGPVRARALALLAVSVAATPVTALLCGLVYVAGAASGAARDRPARNRRTVLITTAHMTKSLLLARKFHEAGNRVVVASTSDNWFGSARFSRAADAFHLLPHPQHDFDGFARTLADVVRSERVDVVVPVIGEAGRQQPTAEAVPALAASSLVLNSDPGLHHRLNDKTRFTELIRAAGLPCLEAHRITDVRQLLDFDFAGRGYVLKPPEWTTLADHRLVVLPYQGHDALLRRLPITPDAPWLLQRHVSGREYCTHATCRDGQITAYVCTESSALQLNYQHVEVPAIWEWVCGFVAAHRLTGQVSFDFIVDGAGVPYAIECNPRAHTAITAFYNSPDLADAYLGPAPAATVRPRPDAKPVYWLGAELGRLRLVRRPDHFVTWIRHLVHGKEAVFDWRDPIPFLMHYHLQFPVILLRSIRDRRRWSRVNWATGKLL